MSGRDEPAAPLSAGTCASSTLPVMGVIGAGAMGAGGAMGVGGAGGAGCGGAAVNGAPPPARAAPSAEPPRKRPKLAVDDSSALRKRILEYKLLRLKSLRDRLTEQLSELYFVQAGGNMMDYAAWRKRPPAPQLLAFLEARRPPPLAPPPPDPPPAVAPAAPAATALPPAGGGLGLGVGVGVGGGGDEVVEKAKQEAYVARRVAELARAGLWAERRLPRVLEPPRPKTHWDYLLEEMAWLAQDFAHERKWKKQAAKKCARAVQKYFQDKAAAAQKAEKAQELQLKRIAAFAAKEIRLFWTNVEKLVEWKRARRVERARKEALDEQLSYIVDRTERYSRALAANLRPAPAPAPASHSPPLSDYGPDADDSADDEDTIAEQERRERPEDTAHELAALQHDAELSLDELVRRYAAAPPPRAADTDTGTGTGTGTDSDTDADTDLGSDTDASDSNGETDSDSSESRPLEELVAGDAVVGAEGGAEEAGERRVEACASVAAALQPTGTTLADTSVGTPVPRLLRHALREYQHVGLHWLATMHARRLNGILADEMGLGKTIQSIALLAHLALGGDWGPHLVVAPTSVVLNWEMEFKKWCPAFKILTYYGTIKERKLKRVGWTKANSFHVCITSYKLVVQDHQSFRRKKWKYLILDEAQNIKNFKSQRWQMLLNFQTERRLLLTGTPLQNSLLELWSLMHFLMPAVFASHSHFREWFADVAAAAEGAAQRNDALVRRLHEVLRPFLLRRLKADVERQMPRKYEHVVMCRLAKRQRFLYDDFMARSKTRDSLASGNLLSVINVLMQLRKVCNHPDLFEPRPVASPLALPALRLRLPARALDRAVHERAELAARLGGDLASLEASGAHAFAAHRARHLAPPRRLIEELGSGAPAPPRPPPARLRLHLRLVPRAPPANPPPAAPPPRAPPAHRARARSPAAPGALPAPSPTPAVARLAARRSACLRRLAATNERRCWRLPLYGADLRAALPAAAPPVPHTNIADVLAATSDIIDRFSVCWSAVRAPAPVLEAGAGAGARGWRVRAARAEAAVAGGARALLALLHAPAARQAVAFPHPRLLQYDCGKLQTLARLLRRLKAGGHRVLIFTQMTRVLDVLEAFLSLHGHTYLRLDGATRVVARQPLVDRFNSDARVFAMILSTRSGGVGLNLTGADCVVFYDSDWNPTMDAQAQDRAHRIGQTRDVHVFRLVTAATVEENILRKADQKRALGHLAIEGGHFTTSVLTQANIKEIFSNEAAPAPLASAEEASAGAGSGSGSGGGGAGELENALAAAEDEADALAARNARAEQGRDLAEFDETLPLDDDPAVSVSGPGAGSAAPPADTPADPHTPACSPAPPHAAAGGGGELAALMKQLTPIEKYAMRVVESSEAGCEAERAALDDMRRQLRDWEDKRRALRRPSASSPPPPPAPAVSPPLTYSGRDARMQVWSSGADLMPVWCPPTPPAAEADVYVEAWAGALYRAGAAGEGALPPAGGAGGAGRREGRAGRDARRRAAVRPPPAPLSLFERAGGNAGAGGRARPRGRPAPPPRDAPPAPEWSPCEEAALRRALRLQRLPAEPGAALQPNWDWAAELVSEVGRCYRSARAARERHDALLEPERARRKHKKPPRARRAPPDAPRPPLARLDAMRHAADTRRRQPKRRVEEASAGGGAGAHNPRQHALLLELGVEYEAPPTPMEVASRRADRIAKEKLKAGAAPPSSAAVAPPATSAAAAAAALPTTVASGGPTPQRIVVAAHAGAGAGASAGAGAGVGGADGPRRVPGPTSSGAAPSAPSPALYRQQQLPAQRHHLKILHHAQGSAVSGGGEASSAALRTLQLQQLALRRAAPPAHPAHPVPASASAPAPHRAAPHHHSHVVVAHLAPAAPAPLHPAQLPPASAPADNHPDDRQH